MEELVAPIGVGLIGCGGISTVHLPAIAELDIIKLIAVCDINKARAIDTAKKYNVEYCFDYKEMLARKDISAIHICTPHHQHAHIAIEALAAGKYVLTEKPMAHIPGDMLEMVRESEKHGNRLGVVFQNRYNAASLIMKEYCVQKKLGELISSRGIVFWKRGMDYYNADGWRGKMATEGGGVLINQSIHTLDLLIWLGGGISEIKGSITTDLLYGQVDVEENAHAVMKYLSGGTGVFFASNSYGCDAPIEIELQFQRGKLHLRGSQLMIDDGGGRRVLFDEEAQQTPGKSYWGAGHPAMIKDFYECILNKRPYQISAREGMKALDAVFKIYESSRSGKWEDCIR